MPISEYIRNLRARVGHDLLFMPGVMALVFNDAGEILIARDRDSGRWHVIGGAMDPDEEPAASAVREVKEETGLDVRAERLVGVYSGPDARYANGDRTKYLTIAIACQTLDDREPRVSDDELLEVRFCAISALPEMSDWVKAKIHRAAANVRIAELVL